jgi:hypothetical protein
MRGVLATVSLVALAMAAGCGNCVDRTKIEPASPATAPPTTNPTTRRVLGLPPGWELAPASTYTARQSAGIVTITANGKHNTGGYETKLFQSPLRIYPPQWLLAHKPPPPDSMVTRAITPFGVTGSFKADAPIASVRVSDAMGPHEVNVEQGDG